MNRWISMFLLTTAVLGLYFRNILLYDESESTVYYHLFSMLCYFTPVFGAILADTYLGKFKYKFKLLRRIFFFKWARSIIREIFFFFF